MRTSNRGGITTSNRGSFGHEHFLSINAEEAKTECASDDDENMDVPLISKHIKNEYPVWIFHPFEPVRLKWDFFISLIMLYLLITVPPKICFQVNLPTSNPWDRVELVIDVIFIIDIIINFHTGFVDDEDNFVNDKSEIADGYLKGWFWLDLITSIPFSEILGAAANNANKSLGAMSKALKIVRIVRLLKLLRILRLVSMMSKWEKSEDSMFKKLGTGLLVILLVAHLVACGFVGVEQIYRVSSLSDSVDDFYGFNSNCWMVRFQQTYLRPIEDQYLRALYWAFTTLTTVGYGDVTPLLPLELVYTIGTQILGSTIFGFIIGNVASIMSHEHETIVAIKEKIATVKHFLTYRHIPQELCVQIRRHYEYSWKRNQVFKEGEILHELPQTLRVQLALHIHKEIIDKVPLLSKIDKDVIPNLVMAFKPICASVSDTVVKEGQNGNEMFFVSHGKLKMEVRFKAPRFKPYNIWLRNLTGGEYFAEYAVMLDQAKHPASVVAESHCDMFMLERYDFLEFGEDYPITYNDLLRQGLKRYQAMTEIVEKAYRIHMTKARFASSHEPHEEPEPESELTHLRPGTVVTFDMRVKHQEFLEESRRRALGKRCPPEHPLKVAYKSMKQSSRRTIEQTKEKWDKSRVRLCIARAQKSFREQHHPEPERRLTEIMQQSRIAEIFARLGLPTRNSFDESVQNEDDIKLPMWVHVRISQWKHRAQHTVAIRGLEAVEKRHQERFNLGRPSVGIGAPEKRPNARNAPRINARQAFPTSQMQMGKSIVRELLFEMDKLNSSTKLEIHEDMSKLEAAMKKNLQELKNRLSFSVTPEASGDISKMEGSIKTELVTLKNEMTTILFEMYKLTTITKAEIREDMEKLETSMSKELSELKSMIQQLQQSQAVQTSGNFLSSSTSEFV